MVGRAKELSLLEHALERARHRPHVAPVHADGSGRRREVAARRTSSSTGRPSEATVLRGRCLSYGEGITFFPLAEVVHQAAGDRSTRDPPRGRAIEARRRPRATRPTASASRGLVAGLFGWAEPGATEDAFWAVRKLLEHLARERPLVVVFDDIHWGEPTFLDLIEHLADWTRDAARPARCASRGPSCSRSGPAGAAAR